jgi:hypothetical protein
MSLMRIGLGAALAIAALTGPASRGARMGSANRNYRQPDLRRSFRRRDRCAVATIAAVHRFGLGCYRFRPLQ